MNRNLGAFTCYGIEYVFDYLGEDRIRQRIEDLEKEPAGSMGLSLNDFTYRDSENCYLGGKGILWFFDLLIQWFNDIEFVIFLYQNSKKYKEDNYFNGGLLKVKWDEYILLMNRMIKRSPDKTIYYESNKLNPYWMEYHFFYMQLSKNIKRALKKKKEMELDLIGSYEFKNNKLTGKLLLELKTRRKPLAGQYLMYREGFVWYDLELKEMRDDLLIYQFTKDKNLYNLIMERDKSIATIKLLKLNSYREASISNLQNVNLEQLWEEIIANYVGNFKEISLRVKEDCLSYSNRVLSNGFMWDIHHYYEHKNNHAKAIEVAILNNTYLDVWRKIPEDQGERKNYEH